jgi:transposase
LTFWNIEINIELISKPGVRLEYTLSLDNLPGRGRPMGFQELTDEQWAFIAPLLPPRAKTGRPRVDDRKVLNGILYVLVTGCRWCDMPRPYGAYQTAWRRFRELQEKGIWHQILQALLDWGYTLGKGKVEAVAVDSTLVEAKKGGKG